LGWAHRVEGAEAGDLYEDRSGNIWFPIENSGVYRYDGLSMVPVGRDGPWR
jgi:hypothetical protein